LPSNLMIYSGSRFQEGFFVCLLKSAYLQTLNSGDGLFRFRLFLDDYFRIGRFEKWVGLLILEKGIFGFILSTRLKSATPSKTETKKQRTSSPNLLKLIKGSAGEYGIVHAPGITRPTKIIKHGIKSPVAIGSFPIVSLSYIFGVRKSNKPTPS
jgi:hypothetical protein